MALIGILSGVTAALTIQTLVGKARRRWPVPLAAVGWAAGGTALSYGILSAGAFLSMRRAPEAPMGPVWGVLALALAMLLLLCGGLGLVHRRRFGLPWGQTFGPLMAEASAATGAGLLLNERQRSLAGVIRGGNSDIAAILDSYQRVQQMLAYFDLALLVSLVFLAAFAGAWAGRHHIPGESVA